MHRLFLMRRIAPLLDVLCDKDLYHIQIVDGIIQARNNKYDLWFEIDPSKFAKNLDILDQVVKVLKFERDPIVLNRMARIVGYYSNLNNWNVSKLEEQKDRRKGNYEVTDVFTRDFTTTAEEAKAS